MNASTDPAATNARQRIADASWAASAQVRRDQAIEILTALLAGAEAVVLQADGSVTPVERQRLQKMTYVGDKDVHVEHVQAWREERP